MVAHNLGPGPWNLDELTFDLSLTFPLYIPFAKVGLGSEVSSSNFYDGGLSERYDPDHR